MSLKVKLALLITFVAVLLFGSLLFFTQNMQRLETLASKRRLGQIMLSTSNELALGKSILLSDAPNKVDTTSRMLDNIFLMQAAIDATIKSEKIPSDSTASLKYVQIELSKVNLLLKDIRSRLANNETLSQDDILRLDQLDEIIDTTSQSVENYEILLRKEINEIEAKNQFHTNTVIASIITIIISLSAVTYFNVLKPISTLTNSAEEISKGNYEHRTNIHSNDEFQRLGETFNAMASQLNDLINSLNDQVAERTKALETSVEISHRLSTILNLDLLVKEVVEELVAAFHYYYAHIYLFDEEKNNLIMKGGTGYVGQAMLAQGFTIPKGQGLIGRAAANNEVVLVGDVLNAPDWVPYDLLPDTRSEIAVPIAIGDEVLGVFDVQHNILNGLTEQDAHLLHSIANQVAIAVKNAQAYTEAQEQAKREAQITAINRKLQRAATIEDVLKIAVKELGTTLDAKHAQAEIKVAALSEKAL
jgi:nitrate/nitrite-specific signal transduction histidine kinase